MKYIHAKLGTHCLSKVLHMSGKIAVGEIIEIKRLEHAGGKLRPRWWMPNEKMVVRSIHPGFIKLEHI